MKKDVADRCLVSSVASRPPESWLRVQMAKRRKDLESIVRHAHLLSLVLRHPNVPWLAKTVAGCAVAYLLSPIQLIPTFIPVVGQMDDLLVLFVGMKLVHKLTPATILEECEAKSGSPWPVQGESIVPDTHRNPDPSISTFALDSEHASS